MKISSHTQLQSQPHFTVPSTYSKLMDFFLRQMFFYKTCCTNVPKRFWNSVYWRTYETFST